jgi:hypothetical protein
MADNDDETQNAGLTAPYTAFSSVKTAVRNMKEHGIPGRIDRSVLTNFSGSVASQVMQAFKFLKLASDDGLPTNLLQKLVDAADQEDKWAAALSPVIKSAYAPMFTLDLFSASPAQFVQHFRKNYPGAENVSRKSLTFFVNALQDAKIPVSTYVLKNKKPRSGPVKKRTVKSAGAAHGEAFVSGHGVAVAPPVPTVEKPASEILLGLMHAEMKQPELDAIWTLIKFYKGKGQ